MRVRAHDEARAKFGSASARPRCWPPDSGDLGYPRSITQQTCSVYLPPRLGRIKTEYEDPKPRLRRIPLALDNPVGVEAALVSPDSDLKTRCRKPKVGTRQTAKLATRLADRTRRKTGRMINSCVFFHLLRRLSSFACNCRYQKAKKVANFGQLFFG